MINGNMDPAVFDYFGEVTLGFFQSKLDGKLRVVVTPKSADNNNPVALQITALYTAAIQKSLEVVSKQVEQLALVKKLKDLS